MSRRASLVAAVALLAGFAGLSLWEMAGDSLTSDERVHLPAGYAYWKEHEWRLNPEHPPLVKLVCAAPLLLMDLKMPPTEPDAGLSYHRFQPTFGSRFLFTQDADRILFWGRLPVLLLGLALLALLFRWSWVLHDDPGAGLVTLFLAALDPTLLAHSHYVTTDVALACFGVWALFFLWRFGRTGRAGHLALAAVGMGLALASKFSAIFILPVFLLILWVRWPRAGPEGEGAARTAAPRLRRPVAAAGAVLLMAAIVQGSYFFSPDLTLYLDGIRAVQANHPVDYPAYVHGAFFIGGAWWYPLYALLLKTPLPSLAAIAIGTTVALRDPHRARGTLWFLLLPAAVLAAAVCLFADNYGVRYLIPVTALLLVPAGGCRAVLASPGRLRGLAAAALALWMVGSVLRGAPHFLSYFNELIGSPANAPYVLHDSNVDWGQDLKRLARYQRGRRIPEIRLAYWGPTRPEHYGIRYRPWTRAAAESDRPPPGVYAISVNHLVNLKKRVVLAGDAPNLDWLRRFEPAERVGGSILIYRFP
ncbi:MAG: ArnT family glycosyltransferase [Acidobacteriota bacterium]